MSSSVQPLHANLAARSKANRAERMSFPPSYVVVGVYRLLTDRNLYGPAWQKCKHGFVRGAVVGIGWAVLTFGLQKKFVEVFLKNSPRVTGLSQDQLFGFSLPFSLTTYATIVMVADQVTYVLRFFLSKNLRIVRDRVWDQVVYSRGKGPDFWRPYVEEYAVPPVVREESVWEKAAGNYFGRFIIRRVLLVPLNFYPFIGLAISAYLKAIGTARYLHSRYFKAKAMTEHEIAIFMTERKWKYRSFGFIASLLESLPIVGLVFSISNRIGAAMWAHDLEKQQHAFASGEVQKIPSIVNPVVSEEMGGSWPGKTDGIPSQ